MAINIKFDLVGNPEPPTILLANRNGNILGQLDVDNDSVNLSDKLNDASEFTFTLNKYVDDEITNLWDKVVDFKLVYCKEWDEWFEITVELDEASETVKTVFCKQLEKAELSQLNLYNIHINEDGDSNWTKDKETYKSTILYDENDHSASLLHRLLKDKAPHYSIAHVDSTIANEQRTFSFDKTSIDDAFQEIAEEIGCLFIYHSYLDEDGILRRTISVYDLQQNCNDCGYRGEFTNECPKCKSTNIEYGYGDDTLIFVTSDELASGGIQLTTDTDSVKNCFKLEAGDDLITATVRNCNPNGTDYIIHISNDTKEDMSRELVEKLGLYDELYKEYYSDYVSDVDEDLLDKYNALVDKYSVYNEELQKIERPIKGYASLMNAYYNTIDLSLYLQSGLMPSVEMPNDSICLDCGNEGVFKDACPQCNSANILSGAEYQANLLETSFIPTVAVADVTVASLESVNNATVAMAKTIINPTYKIQVNNSELIKDGNSIYWNGSFVLTNYSDEEDIATTDVISVGVNDDLETFTKQKIEKVLNKENADDYSVVGLFKKDYNDFCSELKKYALNPLTNFHDACQGCIDILIEQGVGNDSTWSDDEEGSDGNLYEKLYVPYYNKLKAIESEIKIREDEIAVISGVYDLEGNLVPNGDGLRANIEQCQSEIKNVLDFEKYLGEKLWLEFCSYRREDVYQNDNYTSDGLNNAEMFERALEFFEVAEKEIYKSAELQHSISTSLNNLLAIPKFKPLVKHFKVGNWIRVQVDDRIFKLRLLEYEIDFGSFDNISVEFSDVTKIKNGITDMQSVVEQSKSMASSYSYIQRQSAKGNEANNTLEQWLEDGLKSSVVKIQNNDNEDITFTKNGLLCRSYDDVTGTYSPKQLKLTHNIMAYTDDDWKSVRMAIGEYEYTSYDKTDEKFVNKVGYGINADAVTAGVVVGSQIVGGDIYSDNYSVVNSTGSYLNLRDGTFSFGGGSLRFEGGKLLISSPDVPTIEQVTEINEQYLKTTTVYAQNLKVGSANIQGELVADSVAAENITGTTISGKTISGGKLLIGNKSGSYAEITSDGILNCSGANFTGAISGSSFKVNGKKTFVASDYTENDLVILRSVLDKEIEMTTEHIEKYDFDGNGLLSALDYVKLQNLLDGITSSITFDTSLEINCDSRHQLLKTTGVSIGVNGIFTKNINSDYCYSSSYRTFSNGTTLYGANGTLTVGSNTVTVTNGIITAIL